MNAEELYELVFTREHRGWMYLRVGAAAVEDALQDAYLAGLEAIERGVVIENPARYVHGILRHVSVHHIERQIRIRDQSCALDPRMKSYEPDPEQRLEQKERKREVVRSLNSLQPGYREILVRAYLAEEPAEQTMARMGINYTQYRLNKSRAKAKVASIASRARGRRRLQLIANKRAA